MRNPHCPLEKLHQELNLWHHPKKLMVNQDPCSGSVAGDSKHGTMAATGEDEPIDSTEELVGAVGGVDESVTTEHLSDGETMILCSCSTMRMSPNPKHQLLP